MVDPKRRLPNWLDPLGIRGSILDPLSLFADAARMVVPPAESISWMMTTAAKRLEGRRIKTHGDPLIEARVASIREVVPAMVVSVPVLNRTISIWDRVELTLDSLRIDGLPVTGAEVTATGIGVADPAAQSVVVAKVEIKVTLNEDDIGRWLEDADVRVEIDMQTGIAEISWARAGWLRVVGEPFVDDGRVSGRPTALKFGRVKIPLPRWLVRRNSRVLSDSDDSLVVTHLRFPDGIHAEVVLTGRDLELAIDIPRLITEIGLEGPRSVARILTL